MVIMNKVSPFWGHVYGYEADEDGSYKVVFDDKDGSYMWFTYDGLLQLLEECK